MDEEGKVRLLTTLGKLIALKATSIPKKIQYESRQVEEFNDAAESAGTNFISSADIHIVKEINMPTSATVPSTPNPETAVLIGTGVRAFLMIFGPVLATYGITVTSSSTEAIIAGIGTLVTLVGVVWSYWQKFQQAKLDHAGNVASARGGQAVKVIAQEGVPPV
jgi:hypothetical protein